MKKGFIGFGEAAYHIALGLKQDGVSGLKATDAVMSDLVKSRAAETDVELLPDNKAIAAWVDMVIVAVPTQFTDAVVDSVLDTLRPGQLYVDITSSSPKHKQEMAKRIETTGAKFADVALLGSVPDNKHRVPSIACGAGALEFIEEMNPLGMKVEFNNGPVGSACAIKLTRSIFMKGIASLLYELLECSEYYGVTEDVVKSVAGTMDKDPFTKIMNRLICSTSIHCKRRGHEMEGSLAILEEARIKPFMTQGTFNQHMSLVPYDFMQRCQGQTPKTWQEVIDIILEKGEK